ncbi:MAG: aspartate aminotransferase family protein [Candidatus Bathyarchaeota archaeon]|nr:aspartate aminotransferase family protein [Candidatus Bathyarchaeota archaeon]MDH5791408.1 aspartate aminotransferase family protein [Candidatus Bathyarchaeota archaeon]
MDILSEYKRQNPGSKAAFDRARRCLPGGSTRSALYWPPFPLCLASGKGAKVWDVDGNERIDFNFNNTTLIMGHNHPKVLAAAQEQLEKGTVLGAPTEVEPLLAEELIQRLEGAERVRFTPSGTEANMQALRVARAHTGREKIVMCMGAYHGSWDAVSVAGGVDVPRDVAESTLLTPYNDAQAAEDIVKKHRDEIAAVIIEPTQRDMTPRPEFLRSLREVTERHDVILIFDEVISFRLSPGGAQRLYGVFPDVTTMGKIIGGGFPVGAYASTEEVMEPLDIPEAEFPEIRRPRMGFSGTFNAHPVSMAAGLAVMKEMKPPVYERMAKLGAGMREGLEAILDNACIKAHVGGVGSFFHVIWTDREVFDHETASTGDPVLARYFSLGMLNRGSYVLGHPNISAVTTEKDVDAALEAARTTVDNMKPIVRERAPHLLTA